jgi:hypothetical protein
MTGYCEMALKLSNNSSRGVTATGEVKSEKIGKLEISYFPSTADDKTEDDINTLFSTSLLASQFS